MPRSASYVGHPFPHKEADLVSFTCVYIYRDADPFFILHFVAKGANSLPQGAYLLLAFEVQIPFSRCTYLRGPNSLLSFMLEVQFPIRGAS